jgi:hypothetical protein
MYSPNEGAQIKSEIARLTRRLVPGEINVANWTSINLGRATLKKVSVEHPSRRRRECHLLFVSYRPSPTGDYEARRYVYQPDGNINRVDQGRLPQGHAAMRDFTSMINSGLVEPLPLLPTVGSDLATLLFRGTLDCPKPN